MHNSLSYLVLEWFTAFKLYFKVFSLKPSCYFEQLHEQKLSYSLGSTQELRGVITETLSSSSI